MEFTADREERLDQFLARMIPDISRSKLSSWIQSEGVWVNGVERKPSFKLAEGMSVSLGEVMPTPIHDLTPIEMDLNVVYEDDFLLVLNKARGVATHPAPGLREATLVNALLARNQSLSQGSEAFRPGIVHRLDKETTGLMVIAKTDQAHVQLATQIAEKSAERRYVGWCKGQFPNPRLRIEAPISRDSKDRRKMAVHPDGKHALTHFKVLKVVEGDTLFAARLETGRTHQIRVHCVSSGHPILGDSIYATGDWAQGPLMLHAAYLGFEHPETKKAMAFFVPPPLDFRSPQLVEESQITDWESYS